MTIIKDKNGSTILETTDTISEGFVMISNKKFDILEKFKEKDDTIVIVNTNILLEN